MGIQHQRILSSLARNESPSRRDFFLKYGIANPTARISELRSMGFPIQGVRFEDENKFGEPTHFYRYYLDFNKLPEHLKEYKNYKEKAI